MWPIKGHHKKCHTFTKDGKWHWHVCPDMSQLQGQKTKKRWRNVTTPSEPAICVHGTMTWLHVDIPTARQPWSCKTWACVWEFLPSRSGTAGLTSSSTFDVHGNPAKAACHLLRTFVKVVKQPWQQTHRQSSRRGPATLPESALLNVASFDLNIKWTGCDLSHLRADRKGFRITACTGGWSPMGNLPKSSLENTYTY